MKTVRNIFFLDIEQNNMRNSLTSLCLDKKFFWGPTPKNLRKKMLLDKRFLIVPPPYKLNMIPPPYLHNASQELCDTFTIWPSEAEIWACREIRQNMDKIGRPYKITK